MAPQWIDGGDLWKSKARSLQLRLRDRFRVAVDRHRHKPLIFPDGYFSATVQRWLQRFRDFRQESLPSSPAFYRKRVSKDFNPEDDSVLLRMLQAVAVPILGNMCHVFMHGLNTVQVYGVEKLHEAVLNRPKGRPLLTVSNHVAAVDDPFVIAALLPPNVLLDAQNLRWTLCATDRCFRNPATSAFFKSVKVLPVARGDGLYQKGMDMAISKLNNGGWVHIFPEGSRSRDGGKTFGSAKRGVGRLVLDADNIPMVVPFVHAGMQDIMPVGAKLPRIGKTVIVIVGDPIQFDDLLISQGSENISRGKLYDSAASRIGHRLQELKNQLDNLVLEQANQLCNQTNESSNRALGLIHQIDWEAFGLGSLLEEEHSLKQSPQAQHHPQLSHQEQDIVTTDRYFKMGFSHQGRFMSRMRGFVDPSEFMGFAARGLFVNHHKVGDVSSEERNARRRFRPLRTWKQFLEANTLRPRIAQ